MFWRTLPCDSPRSALTFVLLVAGSLAAFQASAQEPALSFAADDSRLTWGPCPSFMPKGCEIAVLHGDPAQSNADIFFKVPSNTTVPRHSHTSPERMVLVSGELHVTYDGQQAAVLTPGTYAYGPASRPHKAECRNAGPCILFIAFESPVDAIPSDGESK